MEQEEKVISFETLTENVGKFILKNKTVLIPEMNRIASYLIAGAFRGFGMNAKCIATCQGLDLGKEFTSGKECYPCQITTGDILHFLKGEQERLGDSFRPDEYVYFMPEADGPCRFGMYNKFQRIILDSFPEFREVRIGAMTTDDGYSVSGLVEEEKVSDLRKTGYFVILVSDILDRLLWRTRPYEKEQGMTDEFIENSMHRMEAAFERYGPTTDFEKILDELEDVVEEGKTIIDPTISPKPLVGIVGEIYLRTHVHANQDLIRLLERYGAEVVNASIAEWVNYTTYDKFREAKTKFRLNIKQFRLGPLREHLKNIVSYGIDLYYQELKQKNVYKRINSMISVAEDHKVGHLEKILVEHDLYDFDLGTEACLSIAGIVEYAKEGYNGIVNVYPFTCMPSTTTSAIVRPLMDKMRIPYLDTPYDESIQPGREAAIRTFMYQANQHYKRNGRKAHA